MALPSISATVGGVLKNLLVAIDANGGVAPAHVAVDASGAEKLLALDATLVVLGTKLDALLAAERPYQGAIAMVVGTPQPAQRAVRISCTAAGSVSLTYADASTDVVPVNIGLSYIAGAVTAINSAGTTATATYANMK